MNIDITLLKNLWVSAEFINFQGTESFNYLNIANISDKEDSNQLFFTIYETNPKVEGWFLEKIDRRTLFPQIIWDNPLWTFVIEKNLRNKVGSIAKVIIVDNIYDAVKQLYDYILLFITISRFYIPTI